MAPTFSTPLLATLTITAVLIAGWLVRNTSRKPLPPGPPADPVLGHLRVMPTQKMAETLMEWSKTYGDVMYLHVLGREVIVLGSAEAARALLDQRSANYSCRPKFTVFELLGWSSMLAFIPYGKRFMKHRKILAHHFGQKEVLSYNSNVAGEAQRLVKRLLKNHSSNQHNLHRFTVANIMRVAFGHNIESDDDEFLDIAVKVEETFRTCGPPGNTPVDFFPWLSGLPSWFPGTYDATWARERFPTVRRLLDTALGSVQERMQENNYEKCFATEQLEKLARNDAELDEEDLKGLAGTIFVAGEDPSYSTLRVFFLAMTLYPACQQRAYEETISVVGHNAFPELNDRDSLPYLECLLQEVHRWLTAGPLGIPHRAIKDDIYKGMLIPEGATIVANVRGMSMDESVYSHPEIFDPTRFLPQPEGRGEPFFTATFGFGRSYLGDSPKDDLGKPKLPEVGYTEGLIVEPLPFECDVRPRSEAALKLISQIDG